MISAYIDWLTLSGARPRTITERRSALTAFEHSLAGRSITDATRHDVMAWLARPLAAESRRTYRTHLRAYFTWAAEEGLTATNPTDKVPPVRVPRGTPRPVTDDELRRALAAADARMRAWLLLMALAGLRCLEVANLRPADVILDPVPMLFLREVKGGGTATVPAHPDVLTALAALPLDGDGAWWQMSAHSVSKAVSAFMKSLGLSCTAHALRHFAGTSWYRASGHDLLATQQLLRHASVASTMIYAALDPTRPAEVVGLVRAPLAAVS